MIIELIGLPGAGKSTIVDILLKRRNLHVNYLNYQDFNKEIFNKKKMMLNFFFFVLFNFFCLVPFICKTLKYSPNKVHSMNRLKKLFVMLFILNKFNNRKQVLIMDQGLIQMLISISVINEKEVDINNVFIILKKIIGSPIYKIINIEASISLAIERIESRNKITCEFKNMSLEKRKHILNLYEYWIDSINIDFTCYSEFNETYNARLVDEFITKSHLNEGV